MGNEDLNRPVSVARLTFPLGFTISLIAVLAGGVVSVGGVWYQTRAHGADAIIHLHAENTVAGGGPAYQRDLENGLKAQYAKTRKLLRSMTIHCAKIVDELNCRIELPDVE
jgi:hypothetical protein